MKFSEMPYERPDMSTLKEQFAALTERLQNAPRLCRCPRRFFGGAGAEQACGYPVHPGQRAPYH